MIVNGEARNVPEQTSVAALLEQLDLAKRPVAVELNLSLVPRAQHEQQLLAEGDRLEVVTLVGGG
ncbi:MAG TPA: sulfur carrier protein ThiS [Pirellulales bacterium]|nr:sulfur carrier protein ThiS [Pirellulales bacterium]